MENSEIKDRILKLLNTENMSSAKFADLIGVQRSNISHILSGRNNPGLDFLQKVMHRFPLLNSEWLLLGKGEMFKQTKQAELNFNAPKEMNPFKPVEKISESPAPQLHPIETKLSSPKTIKQIMVFYADNTFEVLIPEKRDLQKENK
jgi:transcriptional regulator with XRE-family HTH domain